MATSPHCSRIWSAPPCADRPGSVVRRSTTSQASDIRRTSVNIVLRRASPAAPPSSSTLSHSLYSGGSLLLTLDLARRSRSQIWFWGKEKDMVKAIWERRRRRSSTAEGRKWGSFSEDGEGESIEGQGDTKHHHYRHKKIPLMWLCYLLVVGTCCS